LAFRGRPEFNATLSLSFAIHPGKTTMLKNNVVTMLIITACQFMIIYVDSDIEVKPKLL